MRGVVRAVVRLVLMALVMAGVLVTATALGLPLAVVLGLSITLAGLAGLIGLARRDWWWAEVDPRTGQDHARPLTAAELAAAELAVDPERHVPRWRRPSLLVARKRDPLRVPRVQRGPLRFASTSEPSQARRVVRYAVIALLDRPDEVLGRQVADLLAGDEVEVLDNGGPYWEVLCPDGLRGWVHRTTLGALGVDHPTFGRRPEPANEPDDILTAILSARGIQ